MPKITAYKCPFTKKLFETRSGYRRHLLKLKKKKAEARVRRKAQRIERQRRKEELDGIYEVLGSVRTIKELQQAIMEIFPTMMASQSGTKAAKRAIAKQMEMVEFDLFSMRYSESVSNTHACPRNGKTNWGGRDKDAPRGYPGFSGRIEYAVMEPEAWDDVFWSISNCLSHFGINTGTGGGRGKSAEGAQQYYYDVKIFLDDFPGLAAHVSEVHEEHKRIIFQKKLKGERVQEPVYDTILVDNEK